MHPRRAPTSWDLPTGCPGQRTRPPSRTSSLASPPAHKNTLTLENLQLPLGCSHLNRAPPASTPPPTPPHTHLSSGELPSQTAQALMPLFQYCSSPLIGSFMAAAPVAITTASACNTRVCPPTSRGQGRVATTGRGEATRGWACPSGELGLACEGGSAGGATGRTSAAGGTSCCRRGNIHWGARRGVMPGVPGTAVLDPRPWGQPPAPRGPLWNSPSSPRGANPLEPGQPTHLHPIPSTPAAPTAPAPAP